MREIKYLAAHHLANNTVKHYIVVIPAVIKHRNQQINSLNYFSDRELERIFGNAKNHLKAYEGTIEYTSIEPTLPNDYHQEKLKVLNIQPDIIIGAFDFYTKIGYDYKKKKYIMKHSN